VVLDAGFCVSSAPRENGAPASRARLRVMAMRRRSVVFIRESFAVP
jgi:hypothetical protein